MLIYLSRQVEDRFSVPVNMPVDGVMAGVDQWRIGHVRRRQNRHIVVKVAGRDCLLSPILNLGAMAHRVPADRTGQAAWMSCN